MPILTAFFAVDSVFAKSALTTTIATTLVWLVVTLLTKPEPPGLQPPGLVLGCAMVYSALFGVGKLLLGSPALGALLVAVALVAGLYLRRHLPAAT